MSKHRYLLSPICILGAALLTFAARAQDVVESSRGETTEKQLPSDEPLRPWTVDPNLLQKEAGDRVEMRPVHAERLATVKLTDVVPPIRFDSGVADISQSYIESLRKALDDLRDRRNVRLHLIGHADDQPLSERLARIYGDNEGLSRERAGEVAEFLQNRLALPAEAISYEWAGATRPIATNSTPEGRAMNRRVEVQVWYDETQAAITEEEVLVKEDFKRIKVCRMETVCKMRFKEGHAHRTRIRNLVQPLLYDEGPVVSENFIANVKRSLENLQDKQNVTVKLIGYTDNVPLTERNERIYGNHLALSRAHAHRAALALQEALHLSNETIVTDGRGSSMPVATNDTAQGRALNRRIEVEFWHDDPLTELPDEPRLCPGAPGSEIVTRVYDPPWGPIAPLQLEQGGRAVIPADYTQQLRRAMTEIADRTNVRLRFIGYTRNERLDRRTAIVYGDDIGLAAARARRAMDTIVEDMKLTAAQAEHEGRGYVQSADVVNQGFTQEGTSHIVVQVVYDEPAVLDDYEGVDIERITRELSPKNPFGLNLMRITVDGEPIDDPNRSSADIQRCTDVALDHADIAFQFDNLQSSPRLSVSAWPTTVQMAELNGEMTETGDTSDAGDTGDTAPEQDVEEQLSLPVAGNTEAEQTEEGAEPEQLVEIIPVTQALKLVETPPAEQITSTQGEVPELLAPRLFGTPVRFRMYANYSAFIDHSEVRLFQPDQSTQATPFKVLPVDAAGFAEWEPTAEQTTAPMRELKYVLRAYGKDGNFDETNPQPLWFVLDDGTHTDVPPQDQQSKELLASYGTSGLTSHNIALGSGTIKVRGGSIPAHHSVWVAGKPVPVDPQGNFLAEEILPAGVHTVEVAVLDDEGNGAMFLRDLEFEKNDWFYIGMADVTASDTHTRGPAELLQGENSPVDYDSSLDARLAFYVNGKFKEDWHLSASADTREGPVDELFSNFMNKAPDSLFRRIDPDYHYPTFGDDSVVEETAPTLGKMYVKLEHDDSSILWGNFKINYAENELAQVDRGLYGGNLHYQTEGTTSFGEQRFTVDGFAAEPGTLASREEFRGTGGSLYFLHNQDLLVGSERLRIELRDKDSGLVSGVVNLRPVLDYDIDYLQGRVVLAEPLNSTVDDRLLVRSGGLSGDAAYLVVRYEYTPGFTELDSIATGGQASVWVNDYVKVGLTTNGNEEGETDSSLDGADVTLRMSPDSWLKVQGGRSEGLVSSALYSDDGGFGFVNPDTTGFDSASADAYRADLSVGFSDVIDDMPGRLTVYSQSLGAGYSAPGMGTMTDVENSGGTFNVRVFERFDVRAKADKREQDQGLHADTQELNLGYQITDRWSVSTGARKDEREYTGPLVPLNREQGERTDGVLQVGYDSGASWRAYAFGQNTLSKSEERPNNDRYGTGGSYRLTERFRMDAEVSDGDLGPGGRLGTNYLFSERTTLYLNYALENERTDNGLRGGRRGNLISGMKRRLSDSSSMFVEERYQETDDMSGLTHATGMTLAPNERWNFGANTDIGTLTDELTGAKIDREAGGVRMGYGFQAVQLSSAVEYRLDKTEQLDTAMSERTTWLFRNSFKFQLNPDWRIVGKYNHAKSESSLGQFYDGGYTEGVIGYGYRPVANDRLNALAKYTYFYNVPTTEQVTPTNSIAQFVQKSHVAALDLTYDLTDSWSIGGKYAYRLGQLSLDRENPQFFDNSAQLYILRTDLRFGEWEGLVEGRMLDMMDLNEQRAGALVGVYRYVGKHFKVGAGYNFTDFSEDLTDLSFRSEGVFINMIGSM
ncbi:MAG TPA: OmpA family protein [Steroidobacteraceae bacterium]|nr:OmpA family protein [Steroidobacteraceae bacterium]